MSITNTQSSRGPSLRRAPRLFTHSIRGWLPIAPFIGFVAVFLLMPAVVVFQRALGRVDGPKAPMVEAITGQYRKSFIFSMQLSAITAILGVIVGTMVAGSIVRLGHRRGIRNAFTGYSAVAANLGGIPLAFAFLAALGMQGLITKLLKTTGVDLIGMGFKVSDFWGIVVVYLYFQIPLMTLIMLPALDGLKPTWREAAANLGAGDRQYWRFVALPLLLPSLIAGFLLLFANAFSAYATAYALSSGSSKLVPVQIRFFLQGNTITGKENLGYALAAWMIIIMTVSMTGFIMLRRRAERWRR